MSKKREALGDAIAELLEDVADSGALLAYAYAMEAEAAERYEELADQLARHNNGDVAELFAKLAVIEGKHAEEMVQRGSEFRVTRRAPWAYRWLDPEGPEVVPVSELHYRITPYAALTLALYNEQRARDFYALLAARSPSEEVRRLAEGLATEEEEHVALIEAWLKKFPEPEPDWAEDPDPPQSQ